MRARFAVGEFLFEAQWSSSGLQALRLLPKNVPAPGTISSHLINACRPPLRGGESFACEISPAVAGLQQTAIYEMRFRDPVVFKIAQRQSDEVIPCDIVGQSARVFALAGCC